MGGLITETTIIILVFAFIFGFILGMAFGKC